MKLLFLVVFLCISTKHFSQVRLGSVFVKSENVEAETTVENSSYVKGFVNNIPSPVINDFLTRYPGAENVSWYINDKEVSGYFSQHDEQVSIAYKKDGLFLYERKTYEGSRLNQSARDFLERETGFSFLIKQVTQVTKENEEVYEVSFEDQKRWHIYRFGRKTNEAYSLIEKTRFKKG